MTDLEKPNCAKCSKPLAVCFCAELSPYHNSTQVLFLQHPQEPDKLLGSAFYAHLALKKSKFKIALSCANLSKALGETQPVDSSQWAVLFYGAQKKIELTAEQKKQPVLIADRKNKIYLPGQKSLKGIVLLDGTWAQAKTLWWRNSWLLKLNRLIIRPSQPSLYGKIRREPKKDCLASIEAAALALEHLDNDRNVAPHLLAVFSKLLERCKTKV